MKKQAKTMNWPLKSGKILRNGKIQQKQILKVCEYFILKNAFQIAIEKEKDP